MRWPRSASKRSSAPACSSACWPATSPRCGCTTCFATRSNSACCASGLRRCRRCSRGPPPARPIRPRRIGYLLRAGDFDAAARVLCADTPGLLTQGALPSVARLLEQFPRDWADASPALQQVRGLLSWARWDFEAMHDAMQRAQASYLAVGDTVHARLALAYRSVALNALGRNEQISPRLAELRREPLGTEARVIVLLACLWHALDLGALQRVGPLLEALQDLLDASSDHSLWYRAHPIPRLNGLPGTARVLDRYVDGVLKLTADAPTPLRAMALAQRALRELWSGRFDDAEAALAIAHADARWLGQPPNVKGVLQLIDALVATLRGRRAAALEAARVLVDEHPPQRGPWSLAGNLFYAARVAGAFDDLPALREHLARLETLRDRVPVSMTRLLRPLQGLRAALEGDHDEAIGAWREAVALEQVTDRLGSAVEFRLRLAAALVTRGDDAAAIDIVTPVAAAVASHAGIGGVLFARSAVAILAQAARGGRLGADLPPILLAWQAMAVAGPVAPRTGPAVPSADAAAQRGAGPGREAAVLSERERDVLERIAAGDSNKLIARAFELSPHTVKRHVANILDKLDLRSRGQAAAWFRQHQP